MYLVDTNVISEIRKASAGRADPGVKRWFRSVRQDVVYLSDVSVIELQTGVLRMVRKDPEQATLLRTWLHEYVLPEFAGRILPVDTAVALRCAELHVPVTAPYRDSMIAATALVHGLTVVTRNVKDFQPMGVSVFNPWQL